MESGKALEYWNVFQTKEERRIGKGTLATTNRSGYYETFISRFHGFSGRLAIDTMNHARSNNI
jgi:hypothetical protein